MDGSSSIEGGNKSTHHGFKSTQGGSRSIVKNENVSKQANTSTMDLNPPAYNNIYNNNTIISTNKSNIDSSNIDNIISNNTDEEILKNENKEVIKNNLLLYGEVLDSK
ncbi:MAG: hypothetical protein E6R13_01345 [Spirochaetes bacterium]|nr:MAG: hypothetical protein E6R13_01345 [Spirochaetota bacterium]